MSSFSTLIWARAYSIRCAFTQALSRNHVFPVETYSGPDEISKALLRVEYNADPDVDLGSLGKRKIDFARHPSQIQRGIALGSEDAKVRVGDCEDYALFWTMAAIKTGKTYDHKLVCAGWTSSSGKALSHMVAQFTWEGSQWWAGNWNRGAPIKGNAVDGMAEKTGRTIEWAVEWLAVPLANDSISLRSPRVLK